MKFLRLDLLAYGPFTDVGLDFPAMGAGLHLIHGPNEAGKSSALRALRALLFGFPARTADNHRHEYKDLRVGATLLNPGGATLSLVRRKANAKTVRGPDDEEILPDDALSPFLGGVSEERFAAIATSNLADLIRGGVDIISGRGDFGEILFGAGGLSRLPEVRRLLEAEAEELFKKGSRATNPRINAALGGLEAARRTAREKSLSSDEWRDAARAVDDALAALDALGARLGDDERELRRLDRLGRALPQLAARLDVLARLERLGDVPLLPEPFAERRQNAVAERGAAIEAARTSRQEIAAIEAELASIEVPDRLLVESKAIGGLREELGGLRKARARRPRLVDQADEAEAAALAILRDFAPGRTLDDAGSLRLTKPQRSAILALERERGAIEAEVAKAIEEVRALTARDSDAPPFEGPDQRRRLDDLAALVARIQSRGDLEEADAKALAEVRRLGAEADDTLARLPRWSGSLDDLTRRPVPHDSAVSHLETSLAKAEAELQTADANVRTNAAEIASIDEQAEGFRAGGVPPSDADLARARTDRDAAWGAIRRAWIEGESTVPLAETALRFEHRVELADRLADALRREADRVSARVALEARRRRLVEAGDGLGSARGLASSRLDALRDEWARLWGAAGIDAGAPDEMRAWASAYRDLMTRAGLIRSARLAAEATGSAAAEARASLDSALRGLCEPAASSDIGLAALLARARLAIERGETARALALGRRTLSDAEARREDWRLRWDEAVRPLGLGPDVVPEVVRDSLDRLDALFDRLAEARRIRREVEEIDRDAARFAGDVAELSRRLGRSGGEGEPEAVAQAMSDALEEAERDQSRRVAAQARRKSERDRLDAAEAVVRDRDALLDALVREARCGSADDLPAVERASAQVRMLRDRLDAIEADLLALGGGAGLIGLITQAEGVDGDRLPSEIQALAERVAADRATRDRLNREVGQLQERLAAMDGAADASAANEEARRWLAAIEPDVEQYVRLKLASAALRRAIERYRELHQGPILRLLGDLFAELTTGSFAGVVLDDQSDPDALPILKGVRPDPKAKAVPVEGMSEGTANSLYLAVRLATLETYLDAHPPLPFVVDDILVNFDDGRSSAALRTLARISRRTQVLFFTHHEHLLALAGESLRPDEFQIHRLPGRLPG